MAPPRAETAIDAGTRIVRRNLALRVNIGIPPGCRPERRRVCVGFFPGTLSSAYRAGAARLILGPETCGYVWRNTYWVGRAIPNLRIGRLRGTVERSAAWRAATGRAGMRPRQNRDKDGALRCAPA